MGRSLEGKRAPLVALLVLLAPPLASAQLADDRSDATNAVDSRNAVELPRLGLASGAFVSGVLTAPSSASPGVIARELAAREGLGPHRVASARRLGLGGRAGTLVELTPVHAGLDVVGAELFVRVDAAGRVRWVSPHPARLDEAMTTSPTLDAREALGIAAGRGASTLLEPARHAELVVFASPGLSSARLAWHLRFEDAAAQQTFRVYIDAHTGRALSAERLARRAPEHRARVYDVSPADGDLEEVGLEALPAGATTLVDEDFDVRNCLDRGRCHEVLTTSGLRRAHFCDMEASAFAGSDGSFLAHVPPTDHADPEDTFAEVQMYHHLRSGLAAFRQWADDPSFALRAPLTAVVNGRVPDLSTTASICDDASELAPTGSTLRIEENAYFWPAGGIGPTALGDRIVMHQTARADWAYDGEIVWHELTHAVMNTLTPLAWRAYDRRGVHYEGGGLHEGFSDYFAATITGRAQIAWYGGTTEAGAAPLNDLEAPADCRAVMTGEEHDESAPWSAALWSVRRLLRSESKRAMFDRALFVVVDALAQHDGFARATELVLAELALGAELLADTEDFDVDARAFLAEQLASVPARFEERGLSACDGRVQRIALGDVKESLQLVGPIVWGLAEHRGQAIPASMQLRVELDEDATGLRVSVEESAAYDDTLREDGMPTRPEITVLIQPGDTPIAWTWDGARGTHDAERTTALRIGPDGSGVAEVRGEFPAGVYHLQLANAGADWIAYGIYVETADAEGDFPADRVTPPGGTSGCAVHARADRGAAWALPLFLLAMLRIARRRFASRGGDYAPPPLASLAPPPVGVCSLRQLTQRRQGGAIRSRTV